MTDEGVLTNAGALFCDDCKESQSRLYCTRGDGLKRICDATRELDSYREERRPMFKSTAHNFMTTIYSMEYEVIGAVRGATQEQVVTK